MTARGLAPLRHRGFRFLVAGQLGSNVGDAFYAVALPWYVLATHGGALLLGGVLAAYGIARASLLTVGGQLSDRWRPWTVMMATDIVRVLAAVALAVAANLGSGGLTEVALPALAHGPLHTGADGYGALIAALGAGALLGTLVAAQVRRAQRPFVVGSLAFLAEAAAIALIPYLGSTLAAAAALVAFGLLNGFGNVVTITAFQRWAPPSAMGRLAGLLMLASLGVFPLSVALAALVVHGFGPALFFPLAAATLAAALLAGLSQRTWRNFGAITPTGARRPDAGRLGTASTSTDSAVHAS
jgi:predicted MFS family arabinose efflux permease